MKSSKYSVLHCLLDNPRTESSGDLQFSLDERGDIGSSFSPILYKTKVFFNPSVLQNIVKNGWKPPVASIFWFWHLILIELLQIYSSRCNPNDYLSRLAVEKVKSSVWSLENMSFSWFLSKFSYFLSKFHRNDMGFSCFFYNVLQKWWI